MQPQHVWAFLLPPIVHSCLSPPLFAPLFLTQCLPWCTVLLQAPRLHSQSPHCCALPCLLSLASPSLPNPTPFSCLTLLSPSSLCMYVYRVIYIDFRILLLQAQVVECRVKWPEKTKGQQPGIQAGLPDWQTDGTSCSPFYWETSVTFEKCAHHTVIEKDVSSPTFNSAISIANGIKHALEGI